MITAMHFFLGGDLLLMELWECSECPNLTVESGAELRWAASDSRRMDPIISEAPLGSWRLGGPLDSFYRSQPQAWPGFPSTGTAGGNHRTGLVYSMK